jgi:DNA-binding transcriptional MerR regulator
MDQIIEFILSLTWQDWATAIGVIFGTITLIAYLDQKRSSKQQQTLLDFVERHLDKDISTDVIKELAEQRRAMEEQIKFHIPNLARNAVLKEQAESHAQAISHHFKEWKQICSELDDSLIGEGLSPEIEEIITDRISPQYEKRWAIDNIRNRITVLSVVIAISSTFLFYPINMLVGIPLAIPLLKDLVELLKIQGISKDFSKNIKYGIVIAYLFGALLLAFLGVALIVDGFIETPGKVVAYGLIFISLVMVVFILKFFRLVGLYLDNKFENV